MHCHCNLNTYALGVGLYVVCALMIVIAGRQTSRIVLPAARGASGPAIVADAPSIQPEQPRATAIPARTNEIVD